MALLYLEAVGPRGEELAMAAGDAIDVPVGFDSDLDSATFDADSYGPDDLRETVVEALTELDADWESHLRILDD